MLAENNCGHVKIYGGGGGTITPPEIRTLHERGITKIYSPEDGRRMGLQGMIKELVDGAADTDILDTSSLNGPVTNSDKDEPKVARLLSLAESGSMEQFQEALDRCRSVPADGPQAPVVGFTGTGGAGKSSLIDELMLRVQRDNPELKIALLCVDPTRKRTGGALLGDRVRMNSIARGGLYMRSIATRGSAREINNRLGEAVSVMQATGYDIIFVETAGIGQGDDSITEHCATSLYVMTPEYGAETQLEKVGMSDMLTYLLTYLPKPPHSFSY